MRSSGQTTPTIQEPRKFFIIYKRDSGWDLAKHIHDSLHGNGVDVFLDTEDLEEGLSKEEWRTQIDKAIEDRQVFVFIVTYSASSSDDIKHELREAQSKGKDVKVFIHNYLWDVEEEVTIKLDGKVVDLRDFQIRRFQNKEELLREVANSTLLVRIIKSSLP